MQQFNYSIADYISGIDEPKLQYDFNKFLDETAGYDLVFVDFADGAADIVLNAGAVQEVINRVNTNKVLDNRFGNIRQQNVVMGLSMGGLCARYALANMTKNFTTTPTETRLLITHDSPHKGTNIPLGLQYMIRMLGGVQLFGYNVYDIYPEYNDAIGLLDTHTAPQATEQLLLYRATTANTFVNNTFLDATYRPMITFGSTGPQPTYRFIATPNGNECANPLFAPGKTFINLGAGVSAGIYARFLFFKVPILSYKLAAQVEAYALPAAGSTNKIAKVYTINNLKLFGFINIFKQLYDNTAYAPGTHLAVDGVPGSNYPLLNVDALNQLTTLPIFKANLYVSFPLGTFLGGYFGVYAYNAGVSYNFTFVSVGSALDVSPYNTTTFSQKYVNGTNQSYPSTSETFIAQETVQNNPSVSNNVHIRFTARNSQWLFNEMESKPNLINCSSECSNPYYISGLSPLCTNGIYSIPGLQRGATVNWSVSPTNLTSPSSGTGSTITLNRIGTSNGTVTVNATITNACNTGAGIIISKSVEIGTAATIQIIGIAPLPNTQMDVSVTTNAPPPYKWYVDGVLVYTQNQSSSSTVTINGGGAGNHTLRCDVTNGCGTASITQLYSRAAPHFIAVDPNPAVNTINVSTIDESSTDANATSKISSQPSFIKIIEIIDRSGNKKKQINYPGGIKTVSVDVSFLSSGAYIIRVYNGKVWDESKIIITRN